MSLASYTRVLVHLRRTSQAPYTPARFNECILNSLNLSGDGLVECCLQDNKLLLQRPAEDVSTLDNGSKSQYKIMHPPFCPIEHLDEAGKAALPTEIEERGVDVGVAVLLESSDCRLLLTRRARHMRTFPGVWVPPGGHVEAGESLQKAVLRELEEETGLAVTEEEREKCNILGMWESVFPPVLAMGGPRRHHVVVYLHLTLRKTSEQLQEEFKLCPEEVDAAAWLSVDLIKLAVWSREQLQDVGKLEHEEPVPITLVNQDGEHAGGTFEPSILVETDKSSGLNFERLSTGSRFALSLWLDQHLKNLDDSRSSQQQLYGKYMKELSPEVELP